MKFSVITLGCPKNSVDSDEIISIIKSNGHIIVSEEEAEIIIVNTCSFLCISREESVNTILELAQLKEKKLKLLCISGCLVSKRWENDIKKEFSEVDVFIPVGKHRDILNYIDPYIKIKKNNSNIIRSNTSSNSYAYIKIAEGCNNFCSYCLIPSIRGRLNSRTKSDILTEVRILADKGIKELIIVAQDVSQWNNEKGNKLEITKLIKTISKLSLFKWIRLLYINPFYLNRDFFKEISEIPNVLHYMDIPFQHIDNKILKLMNRNVTEKKLRELVDIAREEISNICLRTTFITGFPTETEIQYQKMYDFVKETKFDKCGFFPYSDEKGTNAYKLKCKNSEDIIISRLNSLVDLQYNIAEQLGSDLIGKDIEVLVEDNDIEISDLGFPSRSYREAPDIDGYIFIENCNEEYYGEFVNVKITDAIGADLIGEII